MRHRLVAAAAVLASLLAACAPLGTTPSTLPASTSPRAITATTASPVTGSPSLPSTSAVTTDSMGDVEGTVLEVLDGDSFRAQVGGSEEEIRLLGVNAPEHGECHSDRSRSAMAALIEGRDVTMLTAGQDRFGRVLATVFVDGSDVSVMLLEVGAAIALTVHHDDLPEYLAAEDAAFASGRGLWDPGACGGGAPRSGVAILLVEADPPGPDEEGEFVALVNRGHETDLGGWVLRDESSAHRFEFPPGTSIPQGARMEVRTGCGNDRSYVVHWCEGGAVWNNDGDAAFLLDPAGNVVSRLRYPEH